MSIDAALSELNERQRVAATTQHQHALVLAGAGCGKTKTIIARAAFLISAGVPANRIHILTFTRRSASEIVERVRMHLGDAAIGLKATTFHAWCISIIRKANALFGCDGYSVIDRDDQLQLFKAVRGSGKSDGLPTAAGICDIYSLARNTRRSLADTLQDHYPDYNPHIQAIAKVMIAYEERKRLRQYLDYDDILDVVARHLSASDQARSWLSKQYDHILVDEMQDTNPLQWAILDPLKAGLSLFCVGDDAQSIYGFRGADFRNVHNFSERVPNAITLVLDNNYRSTQEILDASNWLLSESPIDYKKNLTAIRGIGHKPVLHTFDSEWEEARWIADDLAFRRESGADWKQHMILVRSSYSGRAIEGALLAKEIPYCFIGGTKLLESAHVRDVLSVLRIVANIKDEIAWMRYLTLWKGVGDSTATKTLDILMEESSIEKCISIVQAESKIPNSAAQTISMVARLANDVSTAFVEAASALELVLSEKYKEQNWESRKLDYPLIKKVASKHDSILSFIEEYVLEPVSGSQVDKSETEDTVTVITIHSAKGSECEVCYVTNVSPGAYPSKYSIGDSDKIEEDRRVLYVALTRAKNELIVTRQRTVWSAPYATENKSAGKESAEETYFFNKLKPMIFEEPTEKKPKTTKHSSSIFSENTIPFGIDLGISIEFESVPPTKVKHYPERGNEMAKTKLEVMRNLAVEDSCGLVIESCAAYYDNDNESVTVVGELTAKQKHSSYVTVQAVIYDTDGDILARKYTNWSSFGLMQSFDIDFDLSDYDQKPKKVKVYPSLE